MPLRKRLREAAEGGDAERSRLLLQAADEIDRLVEAANELAAEIVRLQNERAKLRAEIERLRSR